jgi:hypothetical protein
MVHNLVIQSRLSLASCLEYVYIINISKTAGQLNRLVGRSLLVSTRAGRSNLVRTFRTSDRTNGLDLQGYLAFDAFTPQSHGLQVLESQ